MSYNTTNRGYLSQVDTPSLVFAAFALLRTHGISMLKFVRGQTTSTKNARRMMQFRPRLR
jgi:hypothetical protein